MTDIAVSVTVWIAPSKKISIKGQSPEKKKKSPPNIEQTHGQGKCHHYDNQEAI